MPWYMNDTHDHPVRCASACRNCSEQCSADGTRLCEEAHGGVPSAHDAARVRVVVPCARGRRRTARQVGRAVRA